MRRRDFAIALGAGVGAGIIGYFSYQQLPSSQDAQVAHPDSGREARPRLKPDVVFGRHDGQLTISRGATASLITCAVNPTGATVLKCLDGRHQVEQISASLKATMEILSDESLNAKVALFVAQLAIHGFLAESYYTTIYDVLESS